MLHEFLATNTPEIIAGSTGAVLGRSLRALHTLVNDCEPSRPPIAS